MNEPRHGTASVFSTTEDARLRDVVAMCGGPVAWAVAVIESVQHDLHPDLGVARSAGLRSTGQSTTRRRGVTSAAR